MASSKESRLTKRHTQVVAEEFGLPMEVTRPALVTYRSLGIGVFGTFMRFVGMPLEKIALFMNSSQVRGPNPFQQALRLTFENGVLSPYRVVGPASFTAWLFQYSVMGFAFQFFDNMLSRLLNVKPVYYGPELMEPPSREVQYSATPTARLRDAPALRQPTRALPPSPLIAPLTQHLPAAHALPRSRRHRWHTRPRAAQRPSLRPSSADPSSLPSPTAPRSRRTYTRGLTRALLAPSPNPYAYDGREHPHDDQVERYFGRAQFAKIEGRLGQRRLDLPPVLPKSSRQRPRAQRP